MNEETNENVKKEKEINEIQEIHLKVSKEEAGSGIWKKISIFFFYYYYFLKLYKKLVLMNFFHIK